MAKQTENPIVFTKDFSNKKAGDVVTLSHEIAASIVSRGFAEWQTGEQTKQPILKTSKKKKDEKNNDSASI